MLDELIDWWNQYVKEVITRKKPYDDSDFTFEEFMHWLNINYKSTLE